MVWSVENNWINISKEKVDKFKIDLRERFRAYQKTSALIISEIAVRTDIRNAIQTKNKETLFRLLGAYKEEGTSCEVYDKTGLLLAWSHNFATDVKLREFTSRPESYIMHGEIYSWVIITNPIFYDSSMIGTVVLKQLFDVNYPINNRFINSDLFKGTFTKELEDQITFDFSHGSKADIDSDVIRVPLKSVYGDTLGYANGEAPTLSTYIDEIKNNLLLVKTFLIFLLSIIMVIILVKTVSRNMFGVFKPVFTLLILWVFRYILLFIEFPSRFLTNSVFAPSFFASQFGYGLASSLGEMFITSLFLILTAVIVGKELLNKHLMNNDTSRKYFIHNLLLFFAFPVVFVFLLRGYLAIIISAVNDSTLEYIDTLGILPPYELLIMLFNLLLISVSFVILSISLISLSYLVSKRLFKDNMVVLFAVVSYLVASFFYGMLHPNPLSGNLDRLPILIFFFATFLFINKNLSGEISHYFYRVVKYIVPASIIVLVVSLNSKVENRILNSLEVYATEFSRPIDNWLTFIVDESLNQMSNTDVASSIKDNSDVHKLAFTQWAKSILSRVEVGSSVEFIDSSGKVVSYFQVGDARSGQEINRDRQLPRSKILYVKEEISSLKSYSGYTPLYTDDSIFVGGVKIDVVASKASLFGGKSPEILKTSMREDLKSHYQNVYYSEFAHGERVYTTNDQFSEKYVIPDTVLSYFHGKNHQIFYLREKIDGKRYETVFVKLNGETNRLVAFNAEVMPVQRTIFNILKLSLYIIFVALLVLFIFILSNPNRKKILFSYRSKILTAFLILSAIPIGIAAYFNREFAVSRAEELMRSSLKNETEIAARYIEDIQKSTVSNQIYFLSDSLCRNVAKITSVDFNFYIGSELAASSKPELFNAELMDRRLSPEAYKNVLLIGRHFFVENQFLGKLPYLIGYRPLYDKNSKVIGILAVPTLFKQSSIDEELQERNAFFFGSYSIVIILALLLGSIFANQISKPVRRLTEATLQIGEGNLDYKITSGRTDEFGKLEDAFNRMTQEIKQKRTDIIKYEKEVAWKEMAKQVAHEIKNPLTPIKLSVQHLLKAYKDGAKDFSEILTSSLNMIHEQIETLSRIASEFSNFARMPARNLSEFDIQNVIKESVELFNKYQNIEFKLNLRDEELKINADREEIRRVFINIFRNAIQAMSEKGTVTISARKNDKIIQIEINDNGPGISEEIKGRIFEPNFSTKTDGMGLGLAIVKQTIGSLNGTIMYSSQKDSGTTFIIKLPTL
jgi:two-component system, NtrC family, nitrogen regulation sensor histidine kinase NtrY